jgi:hypothetical protein
LAALPLPQFLKKISMEKITFSSVKSIVMEAVEVLKLNKAAISKVAADEKMTVWAFVILLAPFVVNTLLGAIQSVQFFGLQMKIFLIPVLCMVGVIFLMSLVAQMAFKARGDHMAFFRVIGFAGIAGFASVIPVLLGTIGIADTYSFFNIVNGLAGIWMLVVTYNVLMSYYKLNQQNAIITIVVGIVAAMILQSLLGTLFIGRFYELMYL